MIVFHSFIPNLSKIEEVQFHLREKPRNQYVSNNTDDGTNKNIMTIKGGSLKGPKGWDMGFDFLLYGLNVKKPHLNM